MDDDAPQAAEATTPTSPETVAKWMLEQFQGRYLYQETIVLKIKREFGESFVYRNRNGNPAIVAPVLTAFRKLTADTHVWERGTRAWRPRTDRDKPTRRQD